MDTFTLRKPVPIGVVIGPLMATLFLRIDSSTCSGSGVPYFSITPAPASAISHSMSTPAASTTRVIARGELRPDAVAGDEGHGVLGHADILQVSDFRVPRLYASTGGVRECGALSLLRESSVGFTLVITSVYSRYVHSSTLVRGGEADGMCDDDAQEAREARE